MSQSPEKPALQRFLHDVKTPLATIRALAQLTASQLRARGDEALALRLDKMDAQVDRIQALVQSVAEERRAAESPSVVQGLRPPEAPEAAGAPDPEREGVHR